MSHMSPLMRSWAERRLSKIRAQRQARLEAARDESFRRKATGADEEGSPT
jgi:hypothetical protein